MKLRSCHIDNFGKLSDLHLEFQDGVNLFHEPNAWGKSTDRKSTRLNSSHSAKDRMPSSA